MIVNGDGLGGLSCSKLAFFFEKVHLSSGGNQIVLNYFTDHFTFCLYPISSINIFIILNN